MSNEAMDPRFAIIALRDAVLKDDRSKDAFEDDPTLFISECGLDVCVDDDGGLPKFLSDFMYDVPKGLRCLTLESIVDGFESVKEVGITGDHPHPKWGIFVNLLANANFVANANAFVNANANANANANVNGLATPTISARTRQTVTLDAKFLESEFGKLLIEDGFSDTRIKALVYDVLTTGEKQEIIDGVSRYLYKYRDKSVEIGIAETSREVIVEYGIVNY